jgi:hypothetical protein
VERAVTDLPLFQRINDLASEEEHNWARAGAARGLGTADQARLHENKVQLDQAYDLLHQREARRSAGLDPDEASVRPPDVVERYQQ